MYSTLQLIELKSVGPGPVTRKSPKAPERAQPFYCGSVAVATQSSTDGATTSSRMNFSGYVGHVTCCSAVGLGIGWGSDLHTVHI